MLAELDTPGVSVAAVARRHEVSRGLLHNWRRQFRKGGLTEPAQLQFVPLAQLIPSLTERDSRGLPDARRV